MPSCTGLCVTEVVGVAGIVADFFESLSIVVGVVVLFIVSRRVESDLPRGRATEEGLLIQVFFTVN